MRDCQKHGTTNRTLTGSAICHETRGCIPCPKSGASLNFCGTYSFPGFASRLGQCICDKLNSPTNPTSVSDPEQCVSAALGEYSAAQGLSVPSGGRLPQAALFCTRRVCVPQRVYSFPRSFRCVMPPLTIVQVGEHCPVFRLIGHEPDGLFFPGDRAIRVAQSDPGESPAVGQVGQDR